MKNSSIIEGARYSNQLLPLKASIYHNGSSSYSNLKNLVLSKEISIPKVVSGKEVIPRYLLPEVQAIWHTSRTNFSYNLHIFRYDLNSSEVIPSFSSKIHSVKVFKPIKGVFNHKISYCLLVITETEVIIYGIENDTQSIVNTDFSCKLFSTPVCVEIKNGYIFIGCADGNVYQAIYKSFDLFNYKYLSLYSPGNSLVKKITSVFNKKKTKVSAMSAGSKYLVALTRNIEIYSVKSGIIKTKEIALDEPMQYISVQIVEEDPLFFYCVLPNGVRDYFSSEKIQSLDPPVVENSDINKITFSTPSSFLSIRTSFDRSSMVLSIFNYDQLKNFSRSKPVENYEIHSIPHVIIDASLSEKDLMILTSDTIFYYNIMDSKKFLINCRTQEIYLMYKNYGDIEFMIKYFQLLTDNQEVSKLEGIVKNESIKLHALFVWIYELIKPFWTVDLSKNHDSSKGLNYTIKYQDDLLCLDEVIKKLKILKSRLSFGYEIGKEFIDEFVQTNFYISLLRDFNISFSETFETILTTETDFRDSTLKLLLEICTLSQSIDPLLKTLQNNCPLYLPLDQINLQRGLQLIKENDISSLMKSLEFLSKTHFDQSIISKFNNLGFFYGSLFLIKEKFEFSYETAAILFKNSVKCKKALDLGLEDARDSFLYPFFEAILDLKHFSPCICCDYKQATVDLISIENPVFKVFLKDAQNRNITAANLYWKYLITRNMKIEAIQALINLSQRNDRNDLSVDQKVDFLQTALSIAIGSHLYSEIKLRLGLYEVQKELAARDSTFKSFTLFDSDTLYNDYCYNHLDLRIKILDLIKYKDNTLLRTLFSEYFETISIRDCVLFLGDIVNRNLELVFDILAKKTLDSGYDLFAGLLNVGFEYEMIVSIAKEKLASNIHPDIKLKLLKNLKTFAKFGEFKECERLCEKNFGIKIYK